MNTHRHGWQNLPAALYRAAQVRELDRRAIQDFGIPGPCLMERAGAALFAVLRARWPQAGRLAVVCGIGNNAGDGYVLARLARLAGLSVEVLQVGDCARLKGEALAAFQAMRAMGLEVSAFAPERLEQCEIAVDALFGTGLDRPLEGIWREAVAHLNRAACPLLAADIPSGLHADTGAILGLAVQAEATVSFIGLKQGLFTHQGPDCCGQVYFDDLAVPQAVYAGVEPSAERIGQDLLVRLLPRRPRNGHKGQFGHVLIVGGDHGYTGAARLAAEGALRAGAGKLSLATRAAHAGLLNLGCPEIMSHAVETPDALRELARGADVVAIGPGLGRGEWGGIMLENTLALDKPLVLDADALNLLALGVFKGRALPPETILTPHPGEAARLLGISSSQVQADRFGAIQALQRCFGGVWVLKGAGSLIAVPSASLESGKISLCSLGNPGMACGGMGDLLTGILAALRGQGLDAGQAARAGVCLHAHAGDQAARHGGERGLMPSDLLPWIRRGANPER